MTAKKTTVMTSNRYRAIPQEFFAVQNNGDLSVLEADVDWVAAAIGDEKIRLALINNHAVLVQTPGGMERAGVGDWITRDDSGNLGVITSAEWEGNYEAVSGDGAE